MDQLLDSAVKTPGDLTPADPASPMPATPMQFARVTRSLLSLHPCCLEWPFLNFTPRLTDIENNLMVAGAGERIGGRDS